MFAPGDVSDSASCAAVVEAAVTHFGGLDILVNNAGVVIPGTAETTSDESLDLMLSVNVEGPFYMSRAAIPALRAGGGGVVVNTGSVAAIKGHQDRAPYAPTKGAVGALTRLMAADYVKEGIRVNCVCPGTTRTPAIEDKIRTAADPAAAEAEFREPSSARSAGPSQRDRARHRLCRVHRGGVHDRICRRHRRRNDDVRQTWMT